MRVLVFDGNLNVGQLPPPRAEAGEALVKVALCAISRRDLDLVQGRRPVQVRPTILGHQFVGEVVDGGDAAAASWIGRRVIAYAHRACGGCPACRGGRRWECAVHMERDLGNGLIDGSLAELVSVPVSSLREVPDSIDDDEAVFAHPLATAITAAQRVVGEAPQRVLVIGDGNMGLLLTLVLHAAGHTVSVFGRHPSRRELLWRSGISFTGVQDAEAPEARSDGVLNRESYGSVFECSGRASGFELALRAVRPRGRLILLSDQAAEAGFDMRPVVDNEIQVHGINGGSLDAALEYLTRKRIDILPLVAARMNLSDGAAAFQQAARRGTLKILLHIGREFR
jgi:threonine dehydrogenase-like Zn-dependent dehydrogenase